MEPNKKRWRSLFFQASDISQEVKFQNLPQLLLMHQQSYLIVNSFLQNRISNPEKISYNNENKQVDVNSNKKRKKSETNNNC